MKVRVATLVNAAAWRVGLHHPVFARSVGELTIMATS